MKLIYLLTLFIPASYSYKILVINPKLGYSHLNFMGRIADTLAVAGHDVVTLQPVIDPSLATNGTTKSRVIQRGPFSDLSREAGNDDMKPIWTTSAANPIGLIMFVPMIAEMSVKTITHLLDDKQLLEQLKAEKFDVAITELFDFIGIGVLEAIGLKNIVGAHSSVIVEGTASAIGAPIIPSYMPASYGVTDDSTDIWTRFTNLMFTGASWYFQTGVVSAIDRLLKEKLGSKATPIWDIISNMSWVLDNAEPLLDFDKPTLHKIVHVGGLSVHKPKPLSKEWDQILSLRPRTILISFGSVAESVLMPDLMKKTILDVVKSYPDITFIWKYEEPNEEIFKGIENLVPAKWTPQGDLLADNRLTLFITHGGINSMMETATRGKPVISIPLYADQSKNARLMQKYGFGMYAF
ncbi:UDP-glucoronosyl and UDP-glucosyl transferase [Trichostrongylus colubriformis]|uniref:UDP-glucuronosyltransferase n=1 Tax=Trichostrongylus colubriformis TaxID=6319 RepID=A0AAN8G0Y2_TRICO